MRPKISVYIIAFNEEKKIGDALESVRWADEIVVADSFSTDRTAEIAEQKGAKVIQIPFQGFGELRNKAIAACSNQWVFSLDSDERCTPEVEKEIDEIFNQKNLADVYYVPRRNMFMGRWIKYSGFYPDYRQPQLFRKGNLIFKDDPVHERYDIKSDKSPGYFRAAIIQIPYLDFEELLEKANRYSSLGAEKLFREGRKSGVAQAFAHASWTFLQLYCIKGGFLDGWPGFYIAVGNFTGTFFKYAKLRELWRSANK